MKNHANPKILSEYQRIMKEEARITNTNPALPNSIFANSADEIYRLAVQIDEVAKSSLLPRGYIKRYGLSDSKIAYESIAAHTNLVMALVDRALVYYYGSDFGEIDSEWPRTIDNYSYREIVEAVRIHDLPENDIGDWPDNGSTDRKKKEKLEFKYFQEFFQTYPARDRNFAEKAYRLYCEMSNPNSTTGRLLYLADKTAAIIITLCYDDANASPILRITEPGLSERDLKEMEICDWQKCGYRKASEMWTIDHFCIRKIIELDDDGFFTALIVMYTLMVKGKWYSWREKDYQN